MAQNKAGQVGITLVKQSAGLPEAGQIVIKMTDKHPAARRLAMPQVVGGEDHKPSVHKSIGNVLVPSTVLAQAVDQHHRCDSLPRGFPQPVAKP